MVTEMYFFDPVSWPSLIEVSITARVERGLGECEPDKLDTLIPTKTRRTETVMAMEYRSFLFIVGIGKYPFANNLQQKMKDCNQFMATNIKPKKSSYSYKQ